MTKDLKDSNDYIIKLLEGDKPFSITRLGFGPETYMLYTYIFSKDQDQYVKSINLDMNELYKNCGIYDKNNNIKAFINFWNYTYRSIKSCNALASMNYDAKIMHVEKTFASMHSLPQIHSRVLEPFYICEANMSPWTLKLKGKRVLIINPFVESFKKQLVNNFRIFKDETMKIFMDDQEFIFYKSYQTQAHNYVHDNWEQTLEHMKNDIKKLQFDIALLGCGAYGIPLCDFIKNDMNKSAIYIGGGLQLLFGVIGYRWKIRDDWKQRIKENDIKFISPNDDETIVGHKTIENGCYW